MADPTIAEVAKSVADVTKSVGDTQVALNIVWTMVAGFLVMFMQAGFAMVETGLTRAKNAAHTMAMNFLVYSIGVIGFYFIGFGLQMGGVGAVFGERPCREEAIAGAVPGSNPASDAAFRARPRRVSGPEAGR